MRFTKPDDPPTFIRLRRLLKTMLRAWGFKCESITIDDENVKQRASQAA